MDKEDRTCFYFRGRALCLLLLHKPLSHGQQMRSSSFLAKRKKIILLDMTTNNAPWASGPGEILRHGLHLLRKDNDVNRRLAMISIDNAVELMIKTYYETAEKNHRLRDFS